MARKSIFAEQQNSTPTANELFESFLDDDLKNNMLGLMEFFKEMSLTPRWYATNSFNIKYKGKIIFRFCVAKGGKMVRNAVDLYFTVANENDLDMVLSELPGDTKDFYFKNLRRCTRCNPAHGQGRRIEILGNEYWICAAPEIYIYNPTKEQIEYLKKFAIIRRENIYHI